MKDLPGTVIYRVNLTRPSSSFWYSLFKEYSTDEGDPYYPVPNPRNQELYAKYQSLAVKVCVSRLELILRSEICPFQEPGVTFVGRLASYKYFNMDQAILNALEFFDSEIKNLKWKKNFEKNYNWILYLTV